MIQVGTNLDITDNSGARVVKCVKVLDKTKQSNGYPGTVCVVSVKTLVRKQKSKVIHCIYVIVFMIGWIPEFYSTINLCVFPS